MLVQTRQVVCVAAAMLFAIGNGPVLAQEASEGSQGLAKELANPVASLISVPFQYNYQQEIGADRSGSKGIVSIQPAVPFSLNENCNLISRTIMPLVNQNDIAAGSGDQLEIGDTGQSLVAGGHQFGLGDIGESLFFSPKAPGPGGIIWGVGPILLLPTGTDSLLTSGKWGIGSMAVVLAQRNGWTFGALANHLWSFAGDSRRAEVDSTYLQPFVSYTTKKATTSTLSSELTDNWTGHV